MKICSSIGESHKWSSGRLTPRSANHLPVENVGAKETEGWSPPRSLRCWHLPGSADGFQGTHLSLSLARIGHKCRVVYSPLQGFPFSLSALRGCRVLLSPCLCCSEHDMLKPEKVMDVPSLWSNLNSAQNVSFELALFILLTKNQSQMKGKTLK